MSNRKSKPPPPTSPRSRGTSYRSQTMRVATSPLNPLISCSNCPTAEPAPFHIMFLPTKPLEFARPSGKRFDLELSSRRGVSAPLAHTTTAFARWKISLLSVSKYLTPVTRPCGDVSILRTYDPGRISHRFVATAFGITVTSELDFARTSQPNPRQKPHCTHCERPL